MVLMKAPQAAGAAPRLRPIATAQAGFEHLLAAHLLAFADHAAEFYAGSGNDAGKASALARINLANRPTRRARALVESTAHSDSRK